MIYTPSPVAVAIFLTFVAFVLGISFYFARKAKSAKNYFAAGGSIPWGINGIAFAGDYLSAASFLGICGMIAVYGYDGFLYSIGYLGGWIVALFVVAEPLKRLGKFTFADALDAKFNSKGIQLLAGISTLVVSVFYLIPQMVGAGALVTPLLGWPHWLGVVVVGIIVIIIVSTAGMKSTTYVQFLKGALLIIFSLVLTFLLLNKGLETQADNYTVLKASVNGNSYIIDNSSYDYVDSIEKDGHKFLLLEKNGIENWWLVEGSGSHIELHETLTITDTASGDELYNGAAKDAELFYSVGHASEIIQDGKVVKETGPLSVFSFLSTIEDSTIVLYHKVHMEHDGNKIQLWYPEETPGVSIMKPGNKFKVDEGSDFWSKFNFMSLMIALFFGTAALPHVLIRYYTVATPAAARKSTIVAIAAIGLFYVLTLYMGLGAMVNGVIDVESGNMSAPLLAKAFGTFLFAIISAIAFATVLGTVSGLIVASAGAVAHDLADQFFAFKMTEKQKVIVGKVSAIVVGIIAIGLGIAFKGMNVAYLVGWAFAVAASANLPSIIMLLFWKKTTAKGIVASITTGIVSALGIILQSPDMMIKYGLDKDAALIPLNNPGIISIPLAFLALIVVSLATQKKGIEAK